MTTLDDLLTPGDWFRLQTDAEARTATVHIYGTIGHSVWWDDVASPQLVRELDALDVDQITLYVNSPGGFAHDGVAIMNALARNKANVTAIIDGLAASAATIVILGADEIAMGAGSQLMIHDAWNFAAGQASVMRKIADRLDQTSQTIAGLYAQRAGGTAEEWRAAMLEETWYTADEAVEAGIADRVLTLPGSDEDDAQNVIPIDRAARAFGWQHAGRADAAAPFMPGRADQRAHTTTSVALAAARSSAPQATIHPTQKGGPTMSDAFNQGVRDRLGLPAVASEETMLASLDERLTAPASPALPEGVVTIEESQLEQMRSDAAAGREARDTQIRQARAAAVDAAINDGRIAPARREHWMASLEADPGAVDTLNALKPGLVPLDAKGHTGGIDEASDEDPVYSRVYPTETKEAS